VARSNGAEERRSAILDAAEHEFAERGYEGARVESIAAGVGVRKGALYHYFPGKAALYSGVVRRLVELCEAQIGPALDAPGRFEDRLERILGCANDLLSTRPRLARILVRRLVEGGVAEAEDPSGEPAAMSRLAQRFLRFYEAGIKAGAFRPLASEHVGPSLLGATFLYYAVDPRSASALGLGSAGDAECTSRRDQELRRFVAHGLLAASCPPDRGRRG
jgi:AcrR family transcriptional regulator